MGPFEVRPLWMPPQRPLSFMHHFRSASQLISWFKAHYRRGEIVGDFGYIIRVGHVPEYCVFVYDELDFRPALRLEPAAEPAEWVM